MQWHPILQEIREHLQKSLGIYFNSMLANLYRDGHDSVGWHTDKNPSLGEQPTIASLSFGDSRMFELRKNPPMVISFLIRFSFVSRNIFRHYAILFF